MDASFLDALGPEVRADVQRLGIVRQHRRGTFLMLEGDRNDHVLLVRQGRIKIVGTADDGQELLLAVRGPGELVGELNALAGSDAPRAASAVALDDVTVQSIAGVEFLAFLGRYPELSLALLRNLARRLREATARHAEAGGYDVLHRVTRMLVDQAQRQGRPVDGGLLVSEGLSQADLAGLVAASQKSVARALAVLRSRGLITTGRRSIVVCDLPGLRRFAR
jgi:CRP-like cAMP-binding protein